MSLAKNTGNVGVSLTAYILLSNTVSLSQTSDDVADEGRLVALSSHGNGCHVGSVSLKDDTV